MRLLVFQLSTASIPASSAIPEEDAVSWDAVALDRGEPIPPLQDYDALWVMAGPWMYGYRGLSLLIPEKRRSAAGCASSDGAAWNLPWTINCLQMRSAAPAVPSGQPRSAFSMSSLPKEGSRDRSFPAWRRQKCLQWHSVRVAQQPEEAVLLAKSAACSCQAMRIGDRAYSMQYHVELEPDTIPIGRGAGYAEALASARGSLRA